MLSYFINLDRRPDRRAMMEERFSELGLNVERFTAVTPADLTDADIKTYCPIGHDERMAPVELSCTLSHRRIMERFLQTSEPYVAIFEDDIFISDRLPMVLDQIDREGMPCDLLKLETFNELVQIDITPKSSLADFGLHTMQGWHWGAAGYVINRRAAELYLSKPQLGQLIIDHILWREFPDQMPVNARQLYPAVVMQHDRLDITVRRGSDLEAARQDKDNDPKRKTALSKLRHWWRYEAKANIPAQLHRTLKLSHRTIVPFAGTGVAQETNKA